MTLPTSLYLQYMPDETTREQLTQIQQELVTMGLGGRPTRSHSMHLTILHFGYLDETYRQLQDLRPSVSRDLFDQAVHRLIDACRPLLPQTIKVVPAGLEYFGPHGTVLALAMKPSAELDHLHHQVHQELRTILEELGIDDPQSLPHRSRALQVHARIQPHITLVKGVASERVAPEHIQLPAGPLTLSRFSLV